jgi:hypothetical protein
LTVGDGDGQLVDFSVVRRGFDECKGNGGLVYGTKLKGPGVAVDSVVSKVTRETIGESCVLKIFFRESAVVLLWFLRVVVGV